MTDDLVGLVLARYGEQVDVELANQEICRIYLKRRFSDTVTGDRILLKKSHDGYIINGRLPRISLLVKKTPQSKKKPIAANIDQLLLVIAPKPFPSFGIIDDYLIMAEALHIKPVIVFNKIDLLSPEEYQSWQNKLKLYQNLSYSVIFVSTLNTQSFLPLTEALNHHTNVLVGQSGVGKSSIIQKILPAEIIRTAELSTQSQHGQHTTTTTQLYHLSCGGHLIDSPGVRTFSLWSMPLNKIAACFIEFREYLGLCRFKNCQHRTEPDCAILAALGNGAITQERYESYLRFCL